MPNNFIKLLAPDVHRGLAALVSKKLGLPSTETNLKRDPTGEVSFSIEESVRDQDIFIISQIGSGVVNDRVLELLIMINASKTASARRITAIIPNFPYTRQDRKNKSRAHITTKLMADMLTTASCDHVITMDIMLLKSMRFLMFCR